MYKHGDVRYGRSAVCGGLLNEEKKVTSCHCVLYNSKSQDASGSKREVFGEQLKYSSEVFDLSINGTK